MSGTTIGAVLLAAGRARRFDGPKQLAPIAGVPMVRHAALTAVACADHVVIVTGAYRADVEACVADLDVEPAFNSAWQHGMAGSVACGVAHLLRTAASIDACLILLADQPLVTTTDLAAIVAAHRQHPECIIASRYNDKTHGAPCLFPRRHFDELLHLEGPGGARPILRRHAGTVRTVSNPRAGIDIDTPADLRNCASRREKGNSPLHMDEQARARRTTRVQAVPPDAADSINKERAVRVPSRNPDHG